MRAIKNLTYNNLMYVIKRIMKEKHYDFTESENIARRIFDQIKACPNGLSVDQQINQLLTREEYEAMY